MLRNNLAKLMIDRGISATQMFNDTGIARSTISKISNNNTDKISLETIDRICNYLEVTPKDFFDFLAYEVKIHCGFDNFDSLSSVKETHKDSGDFEEPAWLSISFYRGKDVKHSFDYAFTYKGEFEPSYPFDEGYMFYLKDMIGDSSNSSTDIFEQIPVQFKNSILENVKTKLSEYFDVSEESTTIADFDPIVLEILG
ncbi:helix-turn-helix domain-containing protein [Streptococcus pluranimalium]